MFKNIFFSLITTVALIGLTTEASAATLNYDTTGTPYSVSSSTGWSTNTYDVINITQDAKVTASDTMGWTGTFNLGDVDPAGDSSGDIANFTSQNRFNLGQNNQDASKPPVNTLGDPIFNMNRGTLFNYGNDSGIRLMVGDDSGTTYTYNLNDGIIMSEMYESDARSGRQVNITLGSGVLIFDNYDFHTGGDPWGMLDNSNYTNLNPNDTMFPSLGENDIYITKFSESGGVITSVTKQNNNSSAGDLGDSYDFDKTWLQGDALGVGVDATSLEAQYDYFRQNLDDFGDSFWVVFADQSIVGYNPVAPETPVPEPSTYLMFANALLGLGFVAWRRRKA